MKKVKRFLKTGSIRSTMDEELDNNDKNSTRNPMLHETIIFETERKNIPIGGSIEFVPG